MLLTVDTNLAALYSLLLRYPNLRKCVWWRVWGQSLDKTDWLEELTLWQTPISDTVNSQGWHTKLCEYYSDLIMLFSD